VMPDLSQRQAAIARKATVAVTGMTVYDEPGCLNLVQALQIGHHLRQGVEAAQRVESPMCGETTARFPQARQSVFFMCCRAPARFSQRHGQFESSGASRVPAAAAVACRR